MLRCSCSLLQPVRVRRYVTHSTLAWAGARFMRAGSSFLLSIGGSLCAREAPGIGRDFGTVVLQSLIGLLPEPVRVLLQAQYVLELGWDLGTVAPQSLYGLLPGQ